jgi:SAM-dependent methyltransferase
MDNVEKKDKELFDRIAREYARKDITPSSSCARRFQLLSAVNPFLSAVSKTGILLEAACGIGASAEYLKGRYDRYVGIDYSEKLIENARIFHKENDAAEFAVLNVKDAGTSNLPKADFVLAVGALHHFTEIDEALLSLKNAAKPGAYFVAIEPQSGNPFIQLLRFLRTKTDAGYSEDQKFFSEEELRELLARHGFKNAEFQYQGYFFPPFAQVVMRPQWIFFSLSKMAVAADKVLDRHLPSALKILSWNIVIRARFPS